MFINKLTKIKPMHVIFLGAIIVVIGGIIGAIGTLIHNKASSEKTSRIESGVSKNLDISETTNIEINNLKKQNENLIIQSNKHAEKIDSQSNTIDILRRENTELYSKLANTSQNIYENLTGGEGFCILSILLISKNLDLGQISIKPDIKNSGPLRNIEIRIVDENTFGIEDATIDNILKNVIKIDVINKNMTTLIDYKLQLDQSKGVNLNVFFSANNGFFKQLIRMRFLNNKWSTATVVYRDDKIIYQKIEASYPEKLFDKIFK